MARRRPVVNWNVRTSHAESLNLRFIVRRVTITRCMKKTHYGPARNVIGHRVRLARLNLKPVVTQEDLAGRLAAQGISMDRSAISRIENRERYLMDYEISALARTLKVSTGWFFEEAGKYRVSEDVRSHRRKPTAET